MFRKVEAFNQNLCGWDVSSSGYYEDDDEMDDYYWTITSITKECKKGAICGENGTNDCPA
jgi:hypothetical protein